MEKTSHPCLFQSHTTFQISPLTRFLLSYVAAAAVG